MLNPLDRNVVILFSWHGSTQHNITNMKVIFVKEFRRQSVNVSFEVNLSYTMWRFIHNLKNQVIKTDETA